MGDLDKPEIAFIGAGNMAASLIQGLLRDGADPSRIRVADPLPAQLEKFSAQGLTASTDNTAIIDEADVVVLAVKPQVAANVLSGLNMHPGQLLVSIAAGINLQSLNAWTGPDQPIVRCMPNTPALLGAGISALFANSHCSTEQCTAAQRILDAAGTTLWVDAEQQLDAVTAVSGSGPAYFFLLMEAMIDSGQALGLSRDTATTLTIQTALGAARMAGESPDSPQTLRENVTSPGGTTAAALEVMLADGLPDTVQRALAAAGRRAAELSAEFGATPDPVD